MRLYKEFRLLQCSLFTLHKHARRRDYLQVKVEACLQLRDYMLVKTSMSGWRKIHSQSKQNIKMFQFFIIAFRKAMMQKYFRVLAKRREDRSKIRQVRRGYLDKMLRSVFYQFRNVIYRRKLSYFVQTHFKRRQAQKMISGWRSVVD